MKDRLKNYIARFSIIKLYVDVEGDEDEYTGMPVRISSSLMAIQELDEFHFNGYRILRLKDIVKVRRSRCETTQQKILKSTGELENHDALSWLRLGSWRSLLSCLKKQKACVCISSGLIKVNVFAIGEIHHLADKTVVLNSFDAHGQRCSPKHRLQYSDITEVLFGDEYSVTFNNFVKNS